MARRELTQGEIEWLMLGADHTALLGTCVHSTPAEAQALLVSALLRNEIDRTSFKQLTRMSKDLRKQLGR